MKMRIGIIGFGNMGSAIAEGIKADYPVYVFDKDAAKLKAVAGLNIACNVAELLSNSEVVILAVKPQDFAGLLGEIKPYAKDKLFISIAAGITTSSIEKILGIARVVRAMPNMAARINQAVTSLSKGRFASEEDFDFGENLFTYLGETVRLDEGMMDAVTALSGSGPAFVCQFLESRSVGPEKITAEQEKIFLNDFEKAALGLGFGSEEAKLLVKLTFSGTLNFLKKTGIPPSELMKRVASQGGTTEAGLKVLNNGGSLEEAVVAAFRRAKELSRKE